MAANSRASKNLAMALSTNKKVKRPNVAKLVVKKVKKGY